MNRSLRAAGAAPIRRCRSNRTSLVLAGLRIGIGRALIGVVLGEMFSANAGLGFRMTFPRPASAPPTCSSPCSSSSSSAWSPPSSSACSKCASPAGASSSRQIHTGSARGPPWDPRASRPPGRVECACEAAGPAPRPARAGARYRTWSPEAGTGPQRPGAPASGVTSATSFSLPPKTRRPGAQPLPPGPRWPRLFPCSGA